MKLQQLQNELNAKLTTGSAEGDALPFDATPISVVKVDAAGNRIGGSGSTR